MINIVEPILFGTVQGLAEFLPISSSGHLSLLHSVTHFSAGSDLSFDVALHMGTLVAVLIFFWRDIVRIGRAWFRSFRHWEYQSNVDQRLGWLLVLSAIPGAIAGVLLESKAETIFRAPALTATVLILAGIALWVADRFAPQRETLERLTWRHTLILGLGQALAIIPGVSRSGATIALGRSLALTREAAARFSFLMSAPIMLGAGLKQLSSLRHETLTTHQQLDFLIGMVVAGVVGYIAIRVLLQYISRHSYTVFVLYRIALGTAVLITIAITR